jgi:hypothetical protein
VSTAEDEFEGLLLNSEELTSGEKSALLESLRGLKDAIGVQSVSMQREDDDEARDIRAQIQDMTLPQKIKLAMFGDGVVRSILITDTSDLVVRAVLSNPQLRDTEIQGFAANRNVDQQVLRRISVNKTWAKLYPVKLALVLNPKSPADVSVKLIKFLNRTDVKTVARSKQVPGVVSIAARKLISEWEKR